MSVESVMSAVEASEAPAASTSMPAGSDSGKPMVKNIDDIFNIYEGSDDEQEASKNGIEMKEDKTVQAADDKITAKENPKEEVKEEVKEETPENTEEAPKDETSDQLPSKVRVKINGKEEEVNLQDVINSYSGQQEVQRRFTEFDKTKKAFEQEKNNLVGFNEYAKQEIGGLKSSFEGLINQYEKNGYLDKNPMETINQLLDKMGINSNLFERAMFEHNLPDYAKYFNMSDVEREAHIAKKENEYLRRKEQGFNERDQQVKLREEKQRKDFELIKNSGLDDVSYNSLAKELEDAGHKDLTAEKVVEYAKQKPTLDRLVNIFNQVDVDPSTDERARTVFDLIKRFPDTTDEEILEHLDPSKVALKTAQILSQKSPKSNPVTKKGADQDFDEMLAFYKN